MAQDEQASTPSAADPKVMEASDEKVGGSVHQDAAATTNTTTNPGSLQPGSEQAGGKTTDATETDPKTEGSLRSQRRLSNSASEKGKSAFANVDSSDDENTVFWDDDNDAQNPYNWPTWLKVVNCVLISTLTFVTPLASCKSLRPAVALVRNRHCAGSQSSLTRIPSPSHVCAWRAGPHEGV